MPSQLLVTAASFGGAGALSAPGTHEAPGRLLNFNTPEGFRRADFKGELKRAAAAIWRDICSGAAERDPALLLRFLVVAYGDLKRYVFTYWFAFPALKPPTPFGQVAAPQALAAWAADGADGGGGNDGGLAQRIADACDRWRGLDAGGSERSGSGGNGGGSAAAPAPFWLLRISGGGGDVAALPLTEWEAAGGAAAAEPGAGPDGRPLLLLAAADPSHLPLTAGWPLRNMLLLAAARWGARALSVLCVRDGAGGRLDAARSFVVGAALPEVPPGWKRGGGGSGCEDAQQQQQQQGTEPEEEAPDAVGWEPNAAGAVAPRRVDVSALMGPTALAEQAVDLNLRLMRWRAAPALDVGALSRMRCLLLGAGTLGCVVARALLAWGVRDVTFVDSARVAFSNPVRQSLFTFADCLDGGRTKAEAAADALRGVFPAARARGVAMAIPMPGHAPVSDARAAEDVAALDALVAEHDVVFLLTDSRESRWLPALLAAARRKVAITAALGFDGFVVMRHGAPPAATAAAAGAAGAAAGAEASTSSGSGVTAAAAAAAASAGGGGRLGCYFCNDVVAPANSAVDRTLDQQCTVARPGLAHIAGALAVELLAALLQHPAGVDAPAPGPRDAAGAAAALGPVPHMLRGQLSGFSQVAMEGRAFSQCTACSEAALAQWRARGADFVLEALRRPQALEEATGLAELHREAAARAEALAADIETATDDGGDDEDGDDWTEL